MDRNAWIDGDEKLVDEKRFTPFYDGEEEWTAWNFMSPEYEFVEAVFEIYKKTRPDIVIETGSGQGYMTRRIASSTRDIEHLVFESEEQFRKLIPDDRSFTVADVPIPDWDDVAKADLFVADSMPHQRYIEIQRWAQVGKENSLLVVHDTGNGHPPQSDHAKFYAECLKAGLTGVRYANPRGSFVAWKETPSDKVMELLLNLMPIQEFVEDGKRVDDPSWA